MSIHINASFETKEERNLLMKILSPFRKYGERFKVKKGEPYSHIYITIKDTKTPD
ncbi:hypothetical protein DSECCO2_206560 [anaerobic digester metagenome]